MTNPYVWRAPDNRWMARIANEHSQMRMAEKAMRAVKTALVARDLADNNDRIDIAAVGEVAPGFGDFATLNPYRARDIQRITIRVGSNAVLSPHATGRVMSGIVRVLGEYQGDYLILGRNRYGQYRSAWVPKASLTSTARDTPFLIPQVGNHVRIIDNTIWHSMPLSNIVRVVTAMNPGSLEVEVFGRDDNGRFSRQSLFIGDLEVTDEALTHPSTIGRSMLTV